MATSHRLRQLRSLIYERAWYQRNKTYLAGVDEAGYGPLFGPLVAAAVMLKGIPPWAAKLNDSKKLSPTRRKELFDLIYQAAHVDKIELDIHIIDVKEINEIGIWESRWKAMRKIAEGLKTRPGLILVDGNRRIPYLNTCFSQDWIVKGDGKVASIAAASIVAKVIRDEATKELAKEVHPDFQIEKNKGYWSKEHVEALIKHGPTKHHRTKFIETALRNYRDKQNACQAD